MKIVFIRGGIVEPREGGYSASRLDRLSGALTQRVRGPAAHLSISKRCSCLAIINIVLSGPFNCASDIDV
jgi:hypothetical protein